MVSDTPRQVLRARPGHQVRRGVLLALIAVAVIGCGRSGAGEARAFGGTGVSSVPYETDASVVTIHVKLELESGRAKVAVVAPSGATKWAQEYYVGPGAPPVIVDRVSTWDEGPGRWLVTLTTTDAGGRLLAEFHDAG